MQAMHAACLMHTMLVHRSPQPPPLHVSSTLLSATVHPRPGCSCTAAVAAWEQFLQEYKAAHPEVCIIDRLDRIKALQNRSTMLTPLKGEGITLSQVRAAAAFLPVISSCTKESCDECGGGGR